MMGNEIIALAFVVFWVLMIVFIVFASKNKKLKNLAKQNDKDQKLVEKHYPFLIVFNLLIPFFFIVDFPRLVHPYGLNGLYILIIAVSLLGVILWRVNKTILEKAKQREKAGQEYREKKIKLIKRFYPRTFAMSQGAIGVLAALFGVNYINFGNIGSAFMCMFLALVPADNWLVQKFYDKAKEMEGRLK